MSKAKKILSLALALIMSLSVFSVVGNAAASADYSALTSYIEKNVPINNDAGIYSQGSYQAVANVLNSINYELTEDSQNVVDGYLTSLKSAVAGLVADESKAVATFGLSLDKIALHPEDVVTASLSLDTNYAVISAGAVIIYDAEMFEVVGTESSIASVVSYSSGALKDYSLTGSCTNTEKIFSSRNTNTAYWNNAATKAQYKAIMIGFSLNSKVSDPVASEGAIATVQFKVLKDTEFGTSGKIFLSSDFNKTSSFAGGLNYASRSVGAKMGPVSSCITTGQTISLSGAEVTADVKHTPGDEATCTDPQICIVCETELVPATGHTDAEWVEVTPATCTSVGLKTKTCPVCQQVIASEEIAILEHTSVTDEAVPATCTETGLTEGSHCSVCTAVLVEQKEVPALGHDYVNHDAQTATCTAIGWNAYQTCTRCEYTTYEEIPALGHDYVNHDAQTATCTSIGWNAYQTCTRCEYTTYEEIPALGHDYVNHDAQTATCTAIGWNAYQTCSRCDYTTYEENPALGHNYVDHDAQTATCTAIGWNAYQTCSRCDYTTYEEIPATGFHTYSLIEGVRKCAVCGDLFNGEYEGKTYVNGVEKVVKNGIVNGKYYVNDVLQKIGKLAEVDGDYYYVTKTGAVYVGTISLSATQVSGTRFAAGSYEFGSDGKMVIKNGFVNGYYYIDSQLQKLGKVVNIDGDYYYITSNGEVFVGTITLLEDKLVGTDFKPGKFQFREDGKMVIREIINGKYYINGVLQKIGKVIELDTYYYYITKQGATFVGTISLSDAQLADTPFTAGPYQFDSEGKMVMRNGIVEGKYYIDGKLQKIGKLVYIDDGYYYITKQGEVFTGKILLGTEALKGTPYVTTGGIFEFGSDGRLIMQTGIINGKYYVNSQLIKANKVVRVGEDYYYITQYGTVYVGKISLTATKLKDTPYSAGIYEFGKDGKMIMKNGIIDGQYFENGALKKLGKVIEIDGDYYYITKQGDVFVGRISLTATHLSNTTLKPGYYTFGADGKMIIE